VQDANAAVSQNVGEISDLEKRLSNTLIRLSRGSQAPWVLSYSPVAFLQTRPADLPIRISGQNLQSPKSRIIINNREISVGSASASAADFVLPKDSLTPGPDGLIHGKILLVNAEPPTIWTYLWTLFSASTDVFEYQILLRPLRDRLGTYSVETKVVDASTVGQSISRDSDVYTTEVKAGGQSKTEEHCLRMDEIALLGRGPLILRETNIGTRCSKMIAPVGHGLPCQARWPRNHRRNLTAV
jgi:hypothetical protein